MLGFSSFPARLGVTPRPRNTLKKELKILTYGQLKKLVMQLIFSESIAGSEIPETYNNQADYLRMIPGLANDGMIYIATTVCKIPELVPLNSLESKDMGTHTLYELPRDFWQMHNGGIIWPRPLPEGGVTYDRYHWYRVYAKNKLLVPKNVRNLDEMMVEYYRYPMPLGDNPEDDVELDNTPETHAALPYYIAAQLVMYDDPFRYSALWNAFETRLGRITEPVTTEYTLVDNAYDGFNLLGV